MLEIVVCCRDTYIRKWLGDVIEEYTALPHWFINVSMFADGRKLLAHMENGFRFQIVMLDILMNTVSGDTSNTDLPVRIRRYDKNCVIIFIAESVDFAFWGYTVHAFDYLLKPLDKKRVIRSIHDAARLFTGKSPAILPIKAKGINTPVQQSSIIYIESAKHHLKIHMANGDMYQVYGKLDDYEQRLQAGASFLRCHQSFLVNMDYVDGITGRDFIMMNGSRIPIRKSSAAKLKKEFYQYMQANRA